jgi:hypothetical protein
LILSISCIIFGTACKKDISKQQTSHTSLPEPFSIAVTHEQAVIINGMIAKGGFQNPNDLHRKVDSVLAATGKGTAKVISTKVQVLDDGYNDSQEEDDEFDYIPDDPSYIVGYNFPDFTANINTQFQQQLVFVTRGNTMNVIVPFQYTWGIFPTSGTNTITNIQPTTPVQLLPYGSYWGTVTQGSTQYVNPAPGSNAFNQSAGINAFGSAQEVRTKLVSTNGQVKISATADLEVFKVGTEYQAGFVIQSAVNIYNQYTMTASGQIWIEGQTPTPNTIPYTQLQGTVNAVDIGILKNE